MTPPHGVPLDDSDPRLPAQPDPAERRREKQEAHMFECWNKSGGPGWETRQQVDKLRLWVAGASVLGLVISIISPVILGWWLSTRLPAQPRANDDGVPLVKTALAQGKATP